VVGPAGDVHDEVVGALEFGHYPEHREQESQVSGDWRLQQDLPVDQFLDLGVEGINDLLPFGEHLHLFVVATQKSTGGSGQVLTDHGEQLDDLGFDALQLTLELLTMLDHSLKPTGRPLRYSSRTF